MQNKACFSTCIPYVLNWESADHLLAMVPADLSVKAFILDA